MSRQKAVEILYEDSNLLAINKPAGLLSIPGRDTEETSVFALMRQTCSTLFVVHRLDRDTSGVLLFAKNEESHRVLSRQFMERKVTKTYLAIITGRPAQESFDITFRLASDTHGHAVVSTSGKPSHTLCRVVELFSRYTLLEVQPLTGRQHQIRAHLAYIGFPLAIDPIYGSASPITIADIKRGIRKPDSDIIAVSSLIHRIPLHAARLTFLDPVDGKEIRVSADLPKDMRATLSQLRKWSR